MPLYTDLTDVELISLIKKDDHSAYREIYYRYTAILFTHAFSKLKNREEASDAVQDVFSSLWLKRYNMQIQVNVSGYLYVSLRNKILNIIARKKVKGEYLDSLQYYLDTTTETPADYLTRTNQLQAIVDLEIAKMPERMREVFELSRKMHLSHKEIAERLGISEATVKDHVNNALKILRRKLGIVNYLLFIYF